MTTRLKRFFAAALGIVLLFSAFPLGAAAANYSIAEVGIGFTVPNGWYKVFSNENNDAPVVTTRFSPNNDNSSMVFFCYRNLENDSEPNKSVPERINGEFGITASELHTERIGGIDYYRFSMEPASASGYQREFYYTVQNGYACYFCFACNSAFYNSPSAFLQSVVLTKQNTGVSASGNPSENNGNTDDGSNNTLYTVLFVILIVAVAALFAVAVSVIIENKRLKRDSQRNSTNSK